MRQVLKDFKMILFNKNSFIYDKLKIFITFRRFPDLLTCVVGEKERKINCL